MTNPARSDRSVESTVAGFIVWLAHQHLPREDRWSCTQRVEQFLRWQHHQREQGLAHQDEAYYAYLRTTGAAEVLVGEAQVTIGRLRQYLHSTT
jgi:hypothetical protein